MIQSDPLSEVLTTIEARSIVSTGLKASGNWSVKVEAQSGFKFNAVMSGNCWLAVEGSDPVKLTEGDCFLLCKGAPFIVTSDLTLAPLAARDVFAQASNGLADLDCGSGNEFEAIGGRMDTTMDVQFLHSSLPPVVLLSRNDTGARRVKWLLETLKSEISEQLPGASAVSSQIMHMIFIEMIRASASPSSAPRTWLAALSDPQIGRALRLLHSDAQRSWKLNELADAANLSRSQFSARFSSTVGLAPLDYVLHWKMTVAAKKLRRNQGTLGHIARETGYRSEAAFGAAFKRVYGLAPGRYRNS